MPKVVIQTLKATGWSAVVICIIVYVVGTVKGPWAQRSRSDPTTLAINDALSQAHDTGRKVFLHVSSPGWGACRRLEEFLKQHQNILDQHYVVIEIEVDMMETPPIIQQIRGEQYGSSPWMAIFNSLEQNLATSNSPDGKNIGYPSTPPGKKHFLDMLRSTSKISETQLAIIEQNLS